MTHISPSTEDRRYIRRSTDSQTVPRPAGWRVRCGDVDDDELLDRLAAGDEQAFTWLVEQYHPSMLRIAEMFVPSRAVAEEVVQDTWIAVLRGIDGFQRRSSLKAWLFSILVNRARTTGSRERRVTPVEPQTMATVDPARFSPDGSWADPPQPWTDAVDDRLLAGSMLPRIVKLIDELPDSQRQVVTLRDVEGLSASEVCGMLGLTAANQRVLLHRARARLRAALEQELKGG